MQGTLNTTNNIDNEISWFQEMLCNDTIGDKESHTIFDNKESRVIIHKDKLQETVFVDKTWSLFSERRRSATAVSQCSA